MLLKRKLQLDIGVLIQTFRESKEKKVKKLPFNQESSLKRAELVVTSKGRLVTVNSYLW